MDSTSGSFPHDPLLYLEHVVHEIGHYLPSQGPVRTFVHHNTLHHFEGQHFFDAIDSAAEVFGAQTALPEGTYQDFARQGRIAQSDVNRALVEYGVDGSPWLLGGSRRKFIRSLLYGAPQRLSLESLRWRLLERGYLRRFQDDVSPAKIARIMRADQKSTVVQRCEWLERYCERSRSWEVSWLAPLIESLGISEIGEADWRVEHSLGLLWIASTRVADLVHRSANVAGRAARDRLRIRSWVEELINPYLIKFTSSFLDLGLAHLTLTDRSHGLLHTFLSHFRNSSLARPPWLRGDLSPFEGLTGGAALLQLLELEGIAPTEWKEYLLEKALILKGWGGLVYQGERGVAGLAARTTLADFLAVRLLLERMARAYFVEQPYPQRSEVRGSLSSFGAVTGREASEEASQDRATTAYHIFRALQLFPAAGSEVLQLSDGDLQRMVDVVVEYGSARRLRVWQAAYEWNLYSRVAAALLHHNSESGGSVGRAQIQERVPTCQVVCCIDDREESFRRYLEELSPDYQTFGTAGFFGVDAEFHSIYERAAPFCPANVVPSRRVEITAKRGSERRLLGFLKFRTRLLDASMFVENQSRSLLRGWVLALGGLLALVPLSLSTLCPGWMHRVRVYLTKTLLNPADESAVVYAEEQGEDDDGASRFTLDEMAHRVRTLLVTTGLAKQLGPLVVIIGHGSFSTNNPYRSAYDCGACGGRPGRVNSRVFALMANRPDVRERVAAAGVHIPEGTHFVGAFHNTCTDAVEYFDVDALPASHRKLFERFSADVEVARARNAYERCRRFDDVTVHSAAEALAHVESRAHHIAQPRPEYGHATNAICVVGRRACTQGLFLDRRAFLVSYDKSIDPNVTALRNLLRAVIPVCMGINLEYLFSALDNQVYGAGTKLPHNVTSLVGIMTGYCSDLRTGLPAQMVEIHEPTRLMVIVEQEPERLLEIIESEAELGRVIKNHWVTLFAYRAEQNELFVYDHTDTFSRFEEMTVRLPRFSSSLAWVAGKKGHLDFVEIGGAVV